MCPQPPLLRSTIWIRACLPFSARTSHDAQSSVSLSLPAVLRTTSPSTTRLTAVSSDRIFAGVSPRTKWSARMWPQPPVLSSAITICARLPRSAATFHATQFSVPGLATRGGAHDGAVDQQPDLGRRLGAAGDEEAEVVGVDRRMSGETIVPRLLSPFSRAPKNVSTIRSPWRPSPPRKGAVPAKSPVAVQAP